MVHQVKIKMCGMTRREDVDKALDLGVDYLGFVFAKSPRSVSKSKAKELLGGLPDSIKSVGVFADPTEEDILEVLDHLTLDHVQVHGTMPELNMIDEKIVIRALRVKENQKIALSDIPVQYFGVLFDTYVENLMGGTGKSFDWEILRGMPERCSCRVIIAGGLTPENVSQAIGAVNPYMVDVASGIELSPGIKDHDKMVRFINSVKGMIA